MFDVHDQCDSDRLTRAIRSGVYRRARLEVWSLGRLLTSDAPILPGGYVTASWVTGLQRTLDVSVPPVAVWDKYLTLPGLELRPYAGIRLSSRLTVDVPLGRFPFQPVTRARPSTAAVQIQCDDYWSWVVNSGRPAHVYPFAGEVRYAVASLIGSGGLAGTVVTASSTRVTGMQMLDKTHAETVAEYAASIGAEAFVDRLGVPQVRDIPPLGAPTTQCVTGESGTVGSMSESINTSVFNEVACWSSAQNVDFPEQVARVTWPQHPAHESLIGRRRKEFASPLFFTPEQAMAGAQTILAKESSRARTMSYMRLSDPTTDPSDSVLGQLVSGALVVQQVAEIVTPLGAGMQRVDCVATADDAHGGIGASPVSVPAFFGAARFGSAVYS